MCLTTVFCVHLSDHEPYFESRITQFCARLPSMTDSSLTFRVLTYMSSIEPVSFCRKTKNRVPFSHWYWYWYWSRYGYWYSRTVDVLTAVNNDTTVVRPRPGRVVTAR